jgi:hypothetical protein
MMHKEELKAHKRRLTILRVKAAYFGIDCPPHILMEIEDIEVLLNKKNGESTETFAMLPCVRLITAI